MTHWTDDLVPWLEKRNACEEAVAYMRSQPTRRQAWGRCKRGDWMSWWLERALVVPRRRGNPLHRRLVAMSCEFSRRSLRNAGKYRPALDAALTTVERWAAGGRVSFASLIAADSAAESTARSARGAAWSAAWSAARSAAWSTAESAAWSAESAARSAAESAAWSAAESAQDRKLTAMAKKAIKKGATSMEANRTAQPGANR